jgi:hypothetical protein
VKLRRPIVLVALAACWGFLLFTLITRDRTPHKAPAEIIEPLADGGADAGADAAGKGADAATPLASAQPEASAPSPRALRVVSLQWELTAPESIMTDATAGVPFAVETTVTTGLDALQARLARGGADRDGADLAIMSIADFAVTRDKLTALDLRIVQVLGFARGKIELVRTSEAHKPGDPLVIAGSTMPLGAWLGVFGVDAPRDHLRFVTLDAPEAKTAHYRAGPRMAPVGPTERVQFSLVDASRLVPLVIAAPRATATGLTRELEAFTVAHQKAVAIVERDAAAAAARVARTAGAPDALAMVERLGEVEWIGAEAQAASLGMTQSLLAEGTARLVRASLISTQVPDGIDPYADAGAATAVLGPDAGKAAGPSDAGAAPGARLLTSMRGDALSVRACGLLAFAFPKAQVLVSGKDAAAFVAQAKGVFPAVADRVLVSRPTGDALSLDVVANP